MDDEYRLPDPLAKWDEGYEAGVAAERARCADLAADLALPNAASDARKSQEYLSGYVDACMDIAHGIAPEDYDDAAAVTAMDEAALAAREGE